MATKKATKKVSTVNVEADQVNVKGASPERAYIPPIERKSGWDEWQLKDMLRTLSEAAKIRRNKPLMAALKKEARKQLAALESTIKST